MLTRPAEQVSFTVAGRQGVVFRSSTARSVGSWNSHYPAVYALGFSGLTRPGSYRITVHAAGASAVSPAFTVGSPAGLYHQLVLNAVRYFTSERDGADVESSVFDRQPANLTDQHAYVQQLRDGVNNFFVTFIRVLEDGGVTTEVEPNTRAGDYLHGFLVGTRSALFEKLLARRTPESVGLYLVCVDTRDSRASALMAIANMAEPPVDLLVSFLSSSQKTLRLAAARALAQCGHAATDGPFAG
jgi:hypothetical protein